MKSKLFLMVKRLYYKYKYKTNNRCWNDWVFGEWFGKRCNDSALALANYVAHYEKDINVFWVARPECVGLINLDPNITILEMDSKPAIDELSKAGVFFVNEGLQDLSGEMINYSFGGIIVNLWHGVPWKKIGMDSYKKRQVLEKAYSKFIIYLQSFSLFVTSSEPCSKSLASAFLIKNKSQLLETGLPRNALFYDPQKINIARRNILNTLGIDATEGEALRIITYMPTFRDETEKIVDLGSDEYAQWLEPLLMTYNAILIQKAHIVTQQRNKGYDEMSSKRIVRLNDVPAQELMAATDILITDYSSCFFDYLILDRPIIHFLYDYDYYSDEDRGLYYSKDEVVCGDVVTDGSSLKQAIIRNLDNPRKDILLRKERKQKYITYESKDSCKKVAELVKDKINNKLNN